MRNISIRQAGFALMVSTALIVPSSFAADYIVSTPTTVTNGAIGNVLNGADSLTISNSGSIAISSIGTFAISISGGSDNRIDNFGAISTSSIASWGIYNNGQNTIINNVGTIATTGAGSHGIYAGSAVIPKTFAIITNSGSISTDGIAAYAIFGGDDNQITNSGSISTKQDGSIGIIIEDNNKITNLGKITTAGNGANAIDVQGNNIITNSGLISTTGLYASVMQINGIDNKISNSGSLITSNTESYAVMITDKDNELINSGILKTTGSGANAIEILDENNVVNNSGEIYALGANAHAIRAGTGSFGTIITSSGKMITIEGDSFKFEATDSQLNLLAPSFIGGRIDMGNANAVNITTGRSHSTLWDFSTHGATFSFGASGAVPYAWNAVTEQFATIDPTALSAASDVLADMVNSLSDARQANADENWWLSGFGNWSEYGANGIYNDYNIANGSVAVGANAQVNNSFSLGAMAGYGLSALSVNSKWETSQTINSKGFVGGIYGDANFDSAFVSTALYAGILGNDSNRLVNDNLATNSAGETWGIDYATANYNSWFVSPELTLGTNIAGENGFTFTPSVSAKYGYQSIAGYSETGATNGNATFGARIAQTFEANAELAANQKIENGSITYRGGVDYRQNIGASTAQATIIGQDLNLPIDNSAQIIAYAGIDANYQLEGGAAINLSAKAGLGTNGYKSIAGSISLGGKF